MLPGVYQIALTYIIRVCTVHCTDLSERGVVGNRKFSPKTPYKDCIGHSVFMGSVMFLFWLHEKSPFQILLGYVNAVIAEI